MFMSKFNTVAEVTCVCVYVCCCLVWYVVQVSVVKSKHILVTVYLSVDTAVCFLNRSLLLSPSLTHALTHARMHTHTHTCVLFIDIPYLFHILICLLKVDASHIFAYMHSQWRVIFVFTTAALSGGPAMNSI